MDIRRQIGVKEGSNEVSRLEVQDRKDERDMTCASWVSAGFQMGQASIRSPSIWLLKYQKYQIWQNVTLWLLLSDHYEDLVIIIIVLMVN